MSEPTHEPVPQPASAEPGQIAQPSGADPGNAKQSAPGGWNLRNRPFVVASGVAAALAVGLVATVLISTGAFRGGHDVDVTFTLTDSDLGESCIGTGGYSDISSGTPVRVTDGSGALLGAASLGDGAYYGGGCLWAVTLPDVADADFYSVEVGDRGTISKSAAELDAEGWTFDISLG